ncbi:unnamed protein product, partial [Ixodes pacificus]
DRRSRNDDGDRERRPIEFRPGWFGLRWEGHPDGATGASRGPRPTRVPRKPRGPFPSRFREQSMATRQSQQRLRHCSGRHMARRPIAVPGTHPEGSSRSIHAAGPALRSDTQIPALPHGMNGGPTELHGRSK